MMYPYQCSKCGDVEVEQKITDDRLKECPNCHSKDFKRQIGAGTSFRLKGSGWANTGYQ